MTCLLSDSLTVSQVMMDSSPTPPDAHGPDRAADCRNDTWQYLFDVDGYIVITGVLSDDESERESVRALLAPLALSDCVPPPPTPTCNIGALAGMRHVTAAARPAPRGAGLLPIMVTGGGRGRGCGRCCGCG